MCIADVSYCFVKLCGVAHYKTVDICVIIIFYTYCCLSDTLTDPWNVCMCVCMYVCVYVFMYVCVCMFLCMYVCVYVFMYVCLICMCIYIYVYVYIYVCVCVRIYVCVCMYFFYFIACSITRSNTTCLIRNIYIDYFIL